jgi:hypothetical protein
MNEHASRDSVSGISRALFSLPSALIVSVLLYAWTLTYPINIDSSVHAYIASMILKGHWPYVEVWENNFPGTILFVHLPELLLFGRSAFAFHLWDVLWQTAGIFFLYRIVERALTYSNSKSIAAWLACVIVAVYYLSVDNLNVAQRDCYATVILLAAIYLLQTKRVGIAGLIYGIAILIRPTNELYVVALAIWVLYRSGLKSAFTFAVNAQAILVVFLVCVLVTGHFSDIYTVIVRYNSEVYARLYPIGGLFYPFGKYWLALIAIPFGFLALPKEYRWLFTMLLIASILTLIPQKQYLYQYYTTFVLAFALSGIGWWTIVSKVYPLRVLGPVLLFLIILALWTRGTTQKRLLEGQLAGNRLSGPLYWQYDTSSASGYQVLDSVGDYLNTHTTSEERIQFVGEYAYPLYRADRLPATRFITFHSIMLRNTKGELADFQRRWREELLSTLRAKPPKYIVVADAPEYARGHLNGLLGHEILNRDLTELKSIVDVQYHLETKIGAFTLYRRNAG